MSLVFMCPSERSARINFAALHGQTQDECKRCKYACKGANGLGCGHPSNEEDPSCMSELCAVTCASNKCMQKMCSKKFKDCESCMNESNDKCIWSTESGCLFAETAKPDDMSLVFMCPSERSVNELAAPNARTVALMDELLELLGESGVRNSRKAGDW